MTGLYKNNAKSWYTWNSLLTFPISSSYKMDSTCPRYAFFMFSKGSFVWKAPHTLTKKFWMTMDIPDWLSFFPLLIDRARFYPVEFMFHWFGKVFPVQRGIPWFIQLIFFVTVQILVQIPVSNMIHRYSHFPRPVKNLNLLIFALLEQNTVKCTCTTVTVVFFLSLIYYYLPRQWSR